MAHKISLEQLGRLEGSEAGDYWVWLDQMSNRTDMMSDEFIEAYKEELKNVREYIKEAFRIKVIKRVVAQEDIDLVWIDGGEDGDDAQPIEIIDS